MKAPYNHADKALKSLSESMSREFQNFSTSLGFDELNYPEVQKQVSALYTRIDSAVRREYRKMVKRCTRKRRTRLAFLTPSLPAEPLSQPC